MENKWNKVLKWDNNIHVYPPKSAKRREERLKRFLYINEKRKAFKKALKEDKLLLYLKEKRLQIILYLKEGRGLEVIKTTKVLKKGDF